MSENTATDVAAPVTEVSAPAKVKRVRKPAKPAAPKPQTGIAASLGNARKVHVGPVGMTHFRDDNGRSFYQYPAGSKVGTSKSIYDVDFTVTGRQDEKGKPVGYDVRIGSGKSAHTVILTTDDVKRGRLAVGHIGKGRTGHDVLATLAGVPLAE